MRPDHVKYLRCPDCRSELTLRDVVEERAERVVGGSLLCTSCGTRFPIVDHIPRFVPADNYAAGFGLEWKRHSRTQYDGHSGQPLSRRRFFEETWWPHDLTGEVVIEAGSGSGRFTEHAASTGAMVLSLDYSAAVEANYESNGSRENVLIVQADIYKMPFPQSDRIFCFGVLQHTPDPAHAFVALTRQVRPGGSIAGDIYLKSLGRYYLQPKYWVRPITRRVPPERLYRLTQRYVDVMWPVARRVRRIPKVGKTLNWKLLIGDYSHLIDDDRLLREWAHLDTFDMLSPTYDRPATLRTVRQWGARAGLREFEAQYGYNGIEFRGTRPASDGHPAHVSPGAPAAAAGA